MSGPITPDNFFSRRKLVLGGLGFGVLAFTGYNLKNFWLRRPQIQVISHDLSTKGHMIRNLQKINENLMVSEKVDIAIIGSGISGLSTGYFLKKNNLSNFKIYEMNSSTGGNSDYFASKQGKGSWGAHYLPIIRNDDKILKTFLIEQNVIVGEKNDLPIYNEEYLCQEPHERLFIRGQWQDSLIPDFGLDSQSRAEFKQFHEFTNALKNKKGSDGKLIFNIPLDDSSSDPEYLKWDRISFKEFLLAKDWKSEALHWYANYACQDDFGTSHEKTSAWAGLHYFASRSGKAANAEEQSVVTWPEGNGFLKDCLEKNIKDHIELNSSVQSIEPLPNGFKILIQNPSDNSFKSVEAKHVIYCLPRFTAPYLLKDYKPHDFLQYNPWLLAHILVQRDILEKNYALAWDNVKFGESDLGYINNHHQYLTQAQDQVLLTFYYAFTDGTAKENRKKISNWNSQQVKEFILIHLEKYHPGISEVIEKIDYKFLGHGMISPSIDFLWNKRLHELPSEWKGILFAHTDMSGISLFEEGFHQGHRAFQKLKAKL